MELKEYIATIRIHDDYRVKVTAIDEDDAWNQAMRRVQDISYIYTRVGDTFILSQVSIELVEAKK